MWMPNKEDSSEPSMKVACERKHFDVEAEIEPKWTTAQFIKPRPPRETTPNTFSGKTKMVSLSSQLVSGIHFLPPMGHLLGYRPHRPPRQEGQPHRPQERGSVLAPACKGMIQPSFVGQQLITPCSSTDSWRVVQIPALTRS